MTSIGIYQPIGDNDGWHRSVERDGIEAAMNRLGDVARAIGAESVHLHNPGLGPVLPDPVAGVGPGDPASSQMPMDQPPPPAIRNGVAKHATPKAAAVPTVEGLGGPERDCLAAFAWFATIGVHEPEKAQLCFRLGWRPTSGHIKNVIGALRTFGVVERRGWKLTRLVFPEGLA